MRDCTFLVGCSACTMAKDEQEAHKSSNQLDLEIGGSVWTSTAQIYAIKDAHSLQYLGKASA